MNGLGYAKETIELTHELIHTEELNSFMEEVQPELVEGTLSSFLKEMLGQYGRKKKEIIRATEIDTTYAYQIFEGRKAPTRNKILQLAFAFPLTLKETQRALRLGGVNELYPRFRRDCYLIHAINHGYSVSEANALLYRNGEELIYSAEY